MRSFKLIVFLLFTGVACASTPKADQNPGFKKFETFVNAQPDRVWANQLSEKVKKAIVDFKLEKKLLSGKIYGASVRKYDIRNKCASDIDSEMSQMGCERKADVLKNPDTKSPLLTGGGKTIPMIVYLCPDGGVVRLKPEGDPTSKYKPQPLVSKALRYPFDSKFENFDDEIVKVDNSGHAIPKWTKDMNPLLTTPQEQSTWIQSWADDAHTDLKLNCGK